MLDAKLSQAGEMQIISIDILEVLNGDIDFSES